MVEIHIDTKKDSEEEIRKTIRFLQGLIGETSGSSYSSSSPSDDVPPASGGAFNMFGSDDDAPSDYSPEKSTSDDSDEENSFIEIVEY